MVGYRVCKDEQPVKQRGCPVTHLDPSRQTISVAFQTDKPLAAYGALAAQVEAYGFDGISVYNDMLYQPAWLPLLEVARATRRVRIGPAAVNPFTCHPVNIAGHIALIDEASQGRAYLGLARGSWLDFVGLEPRRTVTALREAFGCIRHLLTRSTEPYAGHLFPLAGGDTLRWPILRPDLPFLLGSWGAQTIRACIAWIHEVKVGGTANPDVVPHFRTVIDQAAVAAGRAAGEVGVVIGSVTVVDEDGQAARARARREVALYLPVVADLDPTLELDPELLARIRAAADRYDFDQAAGLISDGLLARFAFAGTPEQVAAQARAILEAGAARVEFGTPHGLEAETGLRLLGERVLPALRG
uniref:LLM class flavin-dependent oxidoreductase n=1 Tax=Litorilinea aerophila TaxID=1204385 RepID=A0A540VI44_9CHLR